MRTMVKLSKRVLRRKLRRGLIIVLWLALGLGGMGYGLYRLGLHVTPPGYPPVIYAPAVRRTESYRRAAQAWVQALQSLDGNLTHLVATPDMGAYPLAQTAQRRLEEAAALSQGISLRYPPASLTSLRDALQGTADLYLEAALLLNRWVGEPTPALYLQTLEALRVARASHAALMRNPWLQTPGPSASDPTGEFPEVPSPWGE